MRDWTVGLVALTCRIRDECAAELRQAVSLRPSPHCDSREAYTKVGEPECYQLLERWSDAWHLDAHLAFENRRLAVPGGAPR